MALETGTFLDDLVIANPPGSDPKSQGDDHFRLVKTVLKNTFPGMAGAAWRVQAKAATFTVVVNDNMSAFNCTAAITANLTAAATLGNKHMFVIIANGGAVTIDPDGAETVNGAATLVIPDGDRAIVFCNGTLFLALVTGTELLKDLSPQLAAALDTNSFAIDESEGSAVASAATTDIWAADGNTVHVTGTTTITSFGTASRVGTRRTVIFDGILTLTDGANLNLPGSANITTAVDDFAIVYAETTTLLKVLYFRADGTAVVDTTVSQATQAALEAETNEDTYAPPDLIKHSPGVAKAWGSFDGTAVTGAADLTGVNASYNLASVVDNGAGSYTVNLDVDFSSANFAVAIGFSLGTTDITHNMFIGAVDKAAGSFRIDVENATPTQTDVAIVDFACYGDQ